MARMRTFLAVELSEEVRETITDLQGELMTVGTEVKWTEPENLHVTLLFLGEVEDREVHRVCRITEETVRGHAPFRMAVEQIGCFPHVRRPRVLWVGIGAGTQELVAIHDALEEPLMDLGYRREERRYTPHITLGRVKSDRPLEGLQRALARHAGWQGGEMTVREVAVLSSELTPEGPLYTVLSRARLTSE